MRRLVRAGTSDLFPIGYYTQADLAFLGQAAPAWTTFDHYFAAIMAPTYPNRIYQHTAQTDWLDDPLLPLSMLPTIWDRLANSGIEGRYYFSDLPVLALWGAKYVPIARPAIDFFVIAPSARCQPCHLLTRDFWGRRQGCRAMMSRMQTFETAKPS